MFSESFAGTLWLWWQQSAVFSLLRRVYRWFRNAWLHSVTHRLLVHPSRVQALYEASLFGRAVRAVLDWLTRLLAAFLAWFGRINAGGLNYRLWQRCGANARLLRYDVLFGLFLALMFLCPHAYWNNAYGLLAALAFLALYLCVCARRGRTPADPTALGLPFLLFLCAAVLSLAFSHAFRDSVRVLLFFFAAFLFCYLAAAAVRDRRSLMTVLGFLYAAVFLTACYAVIQRIMGVEVSSSLTDLSANAGVPGRVYSTLDNPNNYAEFLVLMTPLAAVWAVNVRAKYRNLPLSPFLCCGLAVPFLAMVMTYSRGGWISIAIAALVLLYYADKKWLPLLFLLAVLAAPLLPQSIVTRLGTLVSGHDSSSSFRVHLWRGVIMMLKDHGLTGIGIGPASFAAVYPAYARLAARVGAPHSHMVWMELLVEMGVCGLASFLWFFLRTLRRTACSAVRAGARSRRLALCACLGALLGISFNFFVEYVWFYPRVLFAFFLVCGFAIGLANAEDDPFRAGEN